MLLTVFYNSLFILGKFIDYITKIGNVLVLQPKTFKNAFNSF
jgi:hypothetical protein